jgi:response regulator RpfG family c-di-GMP phosphodiesterase
MESIPEFHVFSKSLVVDSSIESRQGLMRELRGSRMFSNIVEAQSFTHGLHELRTNPVDACLIGTSVTPERAAAFLRLGKKITTNKDCAFITVVRSSSDENTEARNSQLLKSGADQVLVAPYTKKVLTQVLFKTIRNVAQAEKGAEQIIKEAPASKVRYATTAKARLLTANTQSIDPLADHLLAIAEDLKKTADKIAAGEFLAEEDGSLGGEAEEAIRQILLRAVTLNQPTKEDQSWNEHFAACVANWFVNATNSPNYLAREYLRSKLLALTTI